MSGQLTEKQRGSINRIAALVIINAMIFQEVLAKTDKRVKPLQEFRGQSDPISAFIDHWKFILDEINYHPIFYIAHHLLQCISADRSVTTGIEELLTTARQIVDWRASLRHDLAGRIYHRLLAEAKHLGAYYTSIPAAVLLLKLALRPHVWRYDWSDLNALEDLRIADFACGTGTLLMAAADVVSDNHLRACAQEGKSPNLDGLHRILVESIIWGLDVLLSAIHLTASTLALRIPNIPLNVTNLWRLNLGGVNSDLGSLEFMEHQTTIMGTLFARPEQVTGQETVGTQPVSLPDLDLCVMNPPFTRSVGGNLLFGNMPEPERRRMQAKLKRLVKQQGLSASITAGLGSVFVALADRYIKPEGRIALVLPRTLLSGVAWEATRHLIEEQYQLEHIIVSHEAGHWNFSENTNLSEVLVIASKRESNDKSKEGRVVCVNLWRQPRNAVEALSTAQFLTDNNPPDVHTGQGALDITIGKTKIGEALGVPWSWMRQRLWSFPCAFAQSELIRTLFHLLDGKLYLPGKGVIPIKGKLPLCPLNKLGELGFDVRDIHDGFQLSKGTTAYPAFRGHDADTVITLGQEPNHFLGPLSSPKPGRPLRRATDLWQKSSQILIAERLWLKTMRLTSVLVNRKVLAFQWWTFLPNIDDPDVKKSLVLWLNSTLGLLLILGHRQETRGAWIKFKKPVLEQTPVLDVWKIGKRRRKRLAEAFDRLASDNLLAFPGMDGDPTRAAIDQAVADALGLPDISILRELLTREPTICLSMDRLAPV